MRRFHRILLYAWVAPSSVIGLIAAVWALRTNGRCRWVDGVLEVTGPHVLATLSRGSSVPRGIRAITLGHVVVGGSLYDLQETRYHERVHVRQYERWGPLFIPAYLVCSAWLSLRGHHPYLDNPFEVEAYAAEDLWRQSNSSMPPSQE